MLNTSRKIFPTLIFLLIIQGILFSEPVYPGQCNDRSPSVKQGIDPRVAFELIDLTAGQKKQIENIFKALKGKWKGKAEDIECRTRGGEEVEEKEVYTVELSIDLPDKDFLELDFNMLSEAAGIRKAFENKMFIEENHLMFNDGPFNFGVSILHLSESFISYLRKSKVAGKGNIPVEFVRSIAIYSSNSLMIEDANYTNGVLASKTIYELHK